LQRKAGASTASPTFKKERNDADSNTGLPSAAGGGHGGSTLFKQEPDSSFVGVAIKRE
jgi:hypothetical protein